MAPIAVQFVGQHRAGRTLGRLGATAEAAAFEGEKHLLAHTPAYEQARFIGAERVYIVHLDPNGEFTERDWEGIFIEQGHELTNVGGTVDSMRKKRGESELRKAFNQVNKCQPIPKISKSIRQRMAAQREAFDKEMGFTEPGWLARLSSST